MGDTQTFQTGEIPICSSRLWFDSLSKLACPVALIQGRISQPPSEVSDFDRKDYCCNYKGGKKSWIDVTSFLLHSLRYFTLFIDVIYGVSWDCLSCWFLRLLVLLMQSAFMGWPLWENYTLHMSDSRWVGSSVIFVYFDRRKESAVSASLNVVNFCSVHSKTPDNKWSTIWTYVIPQIQLLLMWRIFKHIFLCLYERSLTHCILIIHPVGILLFLLDFVSSFQW